MADQRFFYPDLVENPSHPGVVTITQGESKAVFTGAAFAGLPVAGGQIWILPEAADSYPVALIAEAEGAEYLNTELPLAAPHTGDTITNEKFIVVYGAGAHDIASVASIVARFRNLLQNGAGLTFRKDRIADETLVPDGSIRWNHDTSQFEQKQDGIWEILNVSRLGTARGRWDGSASKYALSASGSVAVNLDNGPHFAVTHTGSFTMQLPTNAEVGDEYFVTFIANGSGHTADFASGHNGVAASVINVEDGARTRLRFSVSAETGGTATGVSVSAMPYLLNDIVEDGGYLFMSNTDGNVDYPKFSGPTAPLSDESWTWVPSLKGDPGSAVVTGTSASSVAIGTGAKSFTIVETLPARGWDAGARVRVASAANPTTRYMAGIVSSYFDGTTLDVTVDITAGSGTYDDWVVTLEGERGLPGADAGQQYIWSTTTTDSDPGTNTVRANNASLASATQLFIDDLSAGGDDLAAYWNTLDDSTNTIKGQLHIKSLVDNDTVIFNVTGLTDASGYTKITVASPSGATAFANGELVSLQFYRSGDKGADGAGTGDVTAASNFDTDNLAIRSDETGKGVQASLVSIDDSGNVVLPVAGVLIAKQVRVLDSDDSHGLSIAAGSNLTANRTLSIWSGDANRTLVLGADLTVSANTTLNGPASTTVAGPIEIAIASEYRTGTDTTRGLGVAETWGAAAPVTLTDAATVAVNLASGINFVLTLGDNRTLGNPTNLKHQSGYIRIVQDGMGSRTLSYASDWEFEGGTAPVLSTAANAEDVFYYQVLGTGRIHANLMKDVK